MSSQDKADEELMADLLPSTPHHSASVSRSLSYQREESGRLSSSSDDSSDSEQQEDSYEPDGGIAAASADPLDVTELAFAEESASAAARRKVSLAAAWRSESQPDARAAGIMFMDVEFHGSQSAYGAISQLCVVSLDLRVSFNRYVFHTPLHADWQQLVTDGFVQLSPCHDPSKAQAWSTVLRELLALLPQNAVLLFKGTVDASRMRTTLENQPNLSQQERDEIRAAFSAKNIRIEQVDPFLRNLCADNLPAFVFKCVFSDANGHSMLRECKVYENLLWRPVLVHVDPSHTVQETVVDMPMHAGMEAATYKPVDSLPFRAEFMATGRQEPVWHTAHTDCLVLRNIVVFLLNYADQRGRLREWALEQTAPRSLSREMHEWTAETYAFHAYVTRVMRATGWLQTHHLMPVSNACERLLAHWADIAARTHLLEVQSTAPPASAAAGAAASDDDDEVDRRANNATTIRNARRKRMNQAGIAVLHAHSWTRVYVPLRTGRDEFKVRALRSLQGVNADDELRVESVYARIERERGELYAGTPIGYRPWYYYPNATGKKGPRVQVMHSRTCTDRKNGSAYAYESTTSVVAYYDFARMQKGHGVPGVRLQFCAMCVALRGDHVPTAAAQAQHTLAPTGALFWPPVRDSALARTLALVMMSIGGQSV